MPSCAFKKCTNNSRNTNKANGVTFHRQHGSMRYGDIEQVRQGEPVVMLENILERQSPSPPVNEDIFMPRFDEHLYDINPAERRCYKNRAAPAHVKKKNPWQMTKKSIDLDNVSIASSVPLEIYRSKLNGVRKSVRLMKKRQKNLSMRLTGQQIDDQCLCAYPATPINKNHPTTQFKVPCVPPRRAARAHESRRDDLSHCDNVISITQNIDISDEPNINDNVNETGNEPRPCSRGPDNIDMQDCSSSVVSMFGCEQPQHELINVLNKISKNIETIKENYKRDGKSTGTWRKLKADLKEIRIFDEDDHTPSHDVMDHMESGAMPPTSAAQPTSGSTSSSAVNSTELLLDAPVFRPTTHEMQDLFSYLGKIAPRALHYGICKIVPPDNFKPPHNLKNVSIISHKQYISRMYNRWGPVVREMTAIKAQLTKQLISSSNPMIDGIEVDIVKLRNLVRKYGGLPHIVRQSMWEKIANEMKFNGKDKKNVGVLQQTYFNFIMPYQTLPPAEREKLLLQVEDTWQRRHTLSQAHDTDPLRQLKRQFSQEPSESTESDRQKPIAKWLVAALQRSQDSIVSGQTMNVNQFKRISQLVQQRYFEDNATPDPRQVEDEYWLKVMSGVEHVCVYSATVKTSNEVGFPVDKHKYASHPWNLKRLGEDPRNVLHFLGKIWPATIPTLHLGMMFSSNCWYMDPLHLPVTEYMHEGPPKIWYGISPDQNDKFRSAMQILCPTVVQNKPVWLSSDQAMVPPQLLIEHGVRLTRLLQHPGEYVVVLPRAFTCSISTGFSVSESLYFADMRWLNRLVDIFKDVQDSYTPSLFQGMNLLLNILNSEDNNSRSLIQCARAGMKLYVQDELAFRAQAVERGIPPVTKMRYLEIDKRCTSVSWQVQPGQCSLCRCMLLWSKIINVTGPKSSVCLKHGIEMYTPGKSVDVWLILFITDEDLRTFNYLKK